MRSAPGIARFCILAAIMVAACTLLCIPFRVFAQPAPVYFQTGVSPWYATDAIAVWPEVPGAGEATEICAKIVNPTATGYGVLLRFYVADFSIGASFTPIQDSSIYLPPSAIVTDCIQWTPSGNGPWSFQARLMVSGYDDEVVERNMEMSPNLRPLTPDTLSFIVRNASPATATISLGLLPHLLGWGLELSQDVIPDLPSGSEHLVELITTPPGVMPLRGTAITDVVAYIGADMLGGFRKVYVDNVPCEGVRLDLAPRPADVNGGTSYEERGAYITAIRGFQVCAIGMEVDLQVPQVVYARIYEAAGLERGGLLAYGVAIVTQPGNTMHYVPVDFELLPCQEYDVSIEYGPGNDFNWIDEREDFEPFDVGGVIRVRDAEYAGDASNVALPRLSIIGFSPGDALVTDLSPEGTAWGTCGDQTTERGLYLVPHETIALVALQWEATFNSVPVPIDAYVFDGTGRTRGALIARGSALATTPGTAMRRIPLTAVLEEGKEYDIVVSFPATIWSCIAENQIVLPFTAGGVVSVNDGEQGGNPGNGILPHFALEWLPAAGATAFSLGKAAEGYPPPLISLDSNASYGLYLTSLTRQEIYSLGWEADARVGETLNARVYAASGTNRGLLLSTGSTVVVEGETRWHDIPVSASLEPGAQYNIEVDFGQMNQWAYWQDFTGMPYSPYGLFEVYATSHDGDPTSHRLIHMRLNGCSPWSTGIDRRLESPPPFALNAPRPNPISETASFDYSLDRAGTVTITVYDVTGRPVAVLLESAGRGAGPGRVRFDGRAVPTGVYFVKMEMGNRSVSRKITVIR